ncbi:MAG: ACP S-malonyltransferase [Cyanothece sp. SIO2G6]|nr:ACP S-malonyltransferase [Cyanothece sp. SIO2G6]
MTTTAWVFPGQGSQAIGMGSDLIGTPQAQQRLQQAEAILGWSVFDVCQSEDNKVSSTQYTQPCLYVIESILADLLMEQGHSPHFVAGHSLGEYVALYVAGVFDFESGLKLVQQRSKLMSQVSEGAMAALMGFKREELDVALERIDGVVLANDNSPAQVVISGTPEAVQSVIDTIRAKRKVLLNVSGAFHSPLLSDAAAAYQPMLDTVTFAEAQIPILSNVDPSPTTNAALLKQRLTRQMTGSVRWREIALQLEVEGVELMQEIGPGKVLTGLMKRTCRGISLGNVSGLAAIAS